MEYQDPIGTLVQGMLQGHQLAMQIKNQKMQEEAFTRKAALDDQEASIRDIMTRQSLMDAGRPLMGGAVQDESLIPGTDSPLKFPVMRPANKERVVKYKGRDGQQQEYELFTPEEQIKRTTDRAQQMKRAGSVPIQTPEHLRKLGLPETMYVPEDHLMQYADSTSQLTPVNTPDLYQKSGGPQQVPFKNLAGVMSAVQQALGIQAGNDRNAATIKAGNERAAAANTSRETVAAGNRTAANTRAGAANASREKAAGIRATTSAANQQEVGDRQEAGFIQRQKEPDLHAERHKVAEMLHTGKDIEDKPLTAGAMTLMRAKHKGLTDEIQGLQINKAKLYRMGAPTDQQIGATGEGQSVTLQDGTVWTKKDGVMYATKGGAPQTSAPQAPESRPRAVNAKGKAVEWDGKAWVPAP